MDEYLPLPLVGFTFATSGNVQATAAAEPQGLTLFHFSAHYEPFLTQNTPKHPIMPPNIPQCPLMPPNTL